MDDGKARARRARIFERRARAAREGVHLPSFIELLRGMDMYGGRLGADSEEFANRVLMRLKREALLDTPLGAALRILTVSIEITDFLEAGKAFSAHPAGRKFTEFYLEDAKRRCDYYSACKGDRDAMHRVAGYCISEVLRHTGAEEVALELSFAALGWLTLAVQPLFRPTNGHRDAQTVGSNAFMRMTQEHDRRANQLVSDKKREITDKAKEEESSGEAADADAPSWAADRKKLSVIVVEALGNVDINQGKDVHREFHSFVGARLPLCPVKDPGRVQATLNREYPHACGVTARVISALADVDHIRFRPFLFIGPAGCGKTSYAQRLLQEFGVPNEVFPCAGTSDSALMGTARRWASGEPSVPLSLIRRYKTASPGVILDELEKAGSSRHNGSLHDCLLGMLEPQSASTWRDPYIQAPVDLSHVIWLATANSPTGIPTTLLDRMTAIEFPIPDHRHLHCLANSMLKRALISRGYDERWARPLDGEELYALYRAWPGGSMRALQRLVEVVIDARNAWSTRQ